MPKKLKIKRNVKRNIINFILDWSTKYSNYNVILTLDSMNFAILNNENVFC